LCWFFLLPQLAFAMGGASTINAENIIDESITEYPVEYRIAYMKAILTACGKDASYIEAPNTETIELIREWKHYEKSRKWKPARHTLTPVSSSGTLDWIDETIEILPQQCQLFQAEAQLKTSLTDFIECSYHDEHCVKKTLAQVIYLLLKYPDTHAIAVPYFHSESRLQYKMTLGAALYIALRDPSSAIHWRSHLTDFNSEQLEQINTLRQNRLRHEKDDLNAQIRIASQLGKDLARLFIQYKPLIYYF